MKEKSTKNKIALKTLKNETAVFAGGCFWCTETLFARLKGVISAVPGYTGGTLPNPTYEQVCGGATGHAEAAKIVFDPAIISYEDLLTIFFFTHDPSTLNRQGNDIGTQYRSAIFYSTPEQKAAAETFVKNLSAKDATGKSAYDKPIVTEVVPLDIFYEAEDYHKNYYETHKDAPYCQIVIGPKVEKLEKKYAALLKDL